MSNQNNPWQQGRDDAQQGRGPQNKRNAPAPEQESYNAGYSHNKNQGNNRPGEKK